MLTKNAVVILANSSKATYKRTRVMVYRKKPKIKVTKNHWRSKTSETSS